MGGIDRIEQRQPIEVQHNQEIIYGKDWLCSKQLVGHFGELLDNNKKLSAPEDVVLTDSTYKLLARVVEDNKISRFNDEMDRLEIDFKHGELSEEVFTLHQSQIQDAYDLEQNTLTREMEWRKATPVNFLGKRFKDSLFMRLFPVQGKTGAYSLTQQPACSITCFSDGDEYTVIAEGPYTSDIRSFSYPVENFHIALRPSQPISINLKFRFFDERRGDHPLSTTIQNYPEIIVHAKQELINVINLFAEDPTAFSKLRKPDNTPDDSTQVAQDLFKFIEEDLLSRHLSPEAYEDFKNSLKYMKSAEYKRVKQILAAEHLGSYDNLAQDVMRNMLKALGIEIGESGIQDREQTILAKIKKKGAAKKFRDVRKKAISEINESPLSIFGKGIFERTEELQGYNQYLDILNYYLLMPKNNSREI